MKLYLNDTIQKPVHRYFEELEVGQIFSDDNGNYYMKIFPEKVIAGHPLTAVALSGGELGMCVFYEEEDLVIPVEAELNVIKYE